MLDLGWSRPSDQAAAGALMRSEIVTEDRQSTAQQSHRAVRMTAGTSTGQLQ